MAGSQSSRYHLIPDPRASMDSNDEDESARLLDPDSDNNAAPAGSRSASRSIIFHPTILLRSIALVFSLSTFIVFLTDTNNSNCIPALVFLPLAIVRQVTVICSHYVGRLVEIRIEVTNTAFKSTSFVKKVGGLQKGVLQILVDVVLIVGLILGVTFGMLLTGCVEGGVLGYFAIIFLLGSIIDAGNPSTVTATLTKPVGAGWEISRVGRTQAAGPEEADLASIFGKSPPQEGQQETSPIPGPSVESMV